MGQYDLDLLQIQSHPNSSLMQEHDVRNDHGHNGFVCSGAKSADYPGADEAVIAVHTRLPDIGKNAHQTTDENCGTSTEEVAEWNDDEVCIAKCNCSSSK